MKNPKVGKGEGKEGTKPLVSSRLRLLLPGLRGVSEGQAPAGTPLVITDPTYQWTVGDLSTEIRHSYSEAAGVSACMKNNRSRTTK